jgi:hypothetical protein
VSLVAVALGKLDQPSSQHHGRGDPVKEPHFNVANVLIAKRWPLEE